MTKLSKRLKRLRVEAGLNQSQFAKAVGVTRACVARWENGEASSMVVRNAFSVCEILNTDLNYLFYGRENTIISMGTRELEIAAVPDAFAIFQN